MTQRKLTWPTDPRRAMLAAMLFLAIPLTALLAWAQDPTTAPAAKPDASSAAPAPAPPKNEPGEADPQPPVPGVDRFAKVSDALYRGSQPEEEGFAALKARGIRTIVNLRAFHSDRDEMKGLGLRYLHLWSKPWHPEEEDVVAFLKAVRNPENQPVYVHCMQGEDRTGMMVAAYRMVEQGWPKEKAMAEMRGSGFHEIWAPIDIYLRKFDPERIKRLVEAAPDPPAQTVK